ncbi:MAG: hypothetical protein ACIAXF_04015 [Phycisphaerales bacterium JB063]
MSGDATHIPDGGNALASAGESDAAVQPDRPVITPDMLNQGDPPTGWFGKQYRRFENWLTLKSTESNRWHRFLAWVFLPLAYRSGIKLGRQVGDGYEAVVPFTTFNKNWYNAMAGAALLANSEVAGGMYIFNKVGPDYTVVCKELHYKFRLPCLGPAIYRVKPIDDIEELKRHKLEFNVTVEMHVVQAVHHKDQKERKVGKATATFHVAPKAKLRARQAQVQKLPPPRLGLGMVFPAVLSLAALVGALLMTQWIAAGVAAVCMFLFSKFAWGALVQHRWIQRWASLAMSLLCTVGLIGLGVWAVIAGANTWAYTAGGGAAALFICAVAVAWPLGRD